MVQSYFQYSYLLISKMHTISEIKCIADIHLLTY